MSDKVDPKNDRLIQKIAGKKYYKEELYERYNNLVDIDIFTTLGAPPTLVAELKKKDWDSLPLEPLLTSDVSPLRLIGLQLQTLREQENKSSNKEDR